MTIFLSIILFLVILHLLATGGLPRWQFALETLLAIVIAGLMMLSYWDWRP